MLVKGERVMQWLPPFNKSGVLRFDKVFVLGATSNSKSWLRHLKGINKDNIICQV
ncbi:hypothetical protein RHMOL_Rhmol05G0170900 [Rhododendron molle]|uniref:Uncharacterized protein n=1 Tax=Rhododendron molle TaxID=49168 RepID=A0ACC0NQ57_RHOML|nr:hypothetical protein RHMOL_Rhmol05G0170900 [Rhododendron molle]